MPVVLEGERTAFEAIGTRWSITTDRPLEAPERSHLAALIDGFDRTWSRFRSDSAVASLAASGGPVDLGSDAPALLGLLETLRARTGGALDVRVGASLERLGYGRSRACSPAEPAPAPAARLERDGTSVRLTPPALLDVGSAGKGRLVDLVAAAVAAAGHERSVVDGSGDIAVTGRALTVALEHPFDATAAIGVVEVADGAIAGSAVNRRAWTAADGRRLHHVLDARTGRPVESIAATWALAPSAMLADALATALFLVPPAALTRRFAFEWVVMRTDGRVDTSDGLPGEVFR